MQGYNVTKIKFEASLTTYLTCVVQRDLSNKGSYYILCLLINIASFLTMCELKCHYLKKPKKAILHDEAYYNAFRMTL